MPNWVKNKVKFEDKKVIKECYVCNENEEGYFDFDKVIPMPKSLHLTSGGNQNVSIIYALSKMDDDKREETIKSLRSIKCDFYGSYYDKIYRYNKYTAEDFEKADKELRKCISNDKKDIFDNVDYKGLGIKNLEDLGNTYIYNILTYGSDTWYDWSCENWGTKWNSCNTYYIDENNIEFSTAWSYPQKVFEEISKQYNTKVEIEYADEDLGSNCGRVVFENGEIIDYEEGDLQFAYQVWGYTEEEIEEMEREEL